MWKVILRTALDACLLAAALAACSSPAHVSLEVVGGCGAADFTSVNVHAWGPAGDHQVAVPNGNAVELSDIPADTEQIGIELVDPNQLVMVEGKTSRIDYETLAAGAALPILMAPPNDFCQVGSLTVPRSAPLVARAGDGVLVAGGHDPSNLPLASAEYYDPQTATFLDVVVPDGLVDDTSGFDGVVLTTLTDGRVLLSGGDRLWTIFDPTMMTFSASARPEPRAYQGVAPVGDDRVMLTGGCLTTDQCTAANAARTTHVFAIDAPQNSPEVGQTLASDAAFVYPTVLDGGPAAGGGELFMIAGSQVTTGTAEVFALQDPPSLTPAATELTGIGAHIVGLDGGAALTAFDADGVAPATGIAQQITPAGALVATAAAPPLTNAHMVELEDGSVLALSGDAPSSVHFYVPTTDAWTAAGTTKYPSNVNAPTMIRLGDGTVLVLPGRDAGTEAWVYRPSLVGATSALAAVDFSNSTNNAILTASDPSRVTRASLYTLTAVDDGLGATALLGGPKMATGSVSAIVDVRAGGFALIAQELVPGRALVGYIEPGVPAHIDRIDGSSGSPSCQGGVVPVVADNTSVAAHLIVLDGTATLTFGPPSAEATLVECPVKPDPEANDRGAWGIAPVGAGSVLDLITVTASRKPM